MIEQKGVFMFLKDLVDKEIFSGKTLKGYCRGVGVSLKTHAVKYLLCASSPAEEPDFAISVSSVVEVGEQIKIISLRPVVPKNCVRIFIDRPIYAFDGIYLGKVADLAMQNFTASRLVSDRGNVYPVTSVTACFDAVILKKEPPYPIGQRIPTPMLSLANDKKSALVTKSVLKCAMGKSALVQLTLSLPPFAFYKPL